MLMPLDPPSYWSTFEFLFIVIGIAGGGFSTRAHRNDGQTLNRIDFRM